MSGRRVLIDMDNTLCDWSGALYKCLGGYGYAISNADNASYPFTINCSRTHGMRCWALEGPIKVRPGFFQTLAPYPEVLSGVRALLALGYDIVLCTTPLGGLYREWCEHEKLSWVQRYLGTAMLSRVIFSTNKSEINGAYLIDDHPQVPSSALSARWHPVLLDQPYNRAVSCPRRVSRASFLEDVLAMFAQDGFPSGTVPGRAPLGSCEPLPSLPSLHAAACDSPAD